MFRPLGSFERWQSKKALVFPRQRLYLIYRLWVSLTQWRHSSHQKNGGETMVKRMEKKKTKINRNEKKNNGKKSCRRGSHFCLCSNFIVIKLSASRSMEHIISIEQIIDDAITCRQFMSLIFLNYQLFVIQFLFPITKKSFIFFFFLVLFNFTLLVDDEK